MYGNSHGRTAAVRNIVASILAFDELRQHLEYPSLVKEVNRVHKCLLDYVMETQRTEKKIRVVELMREYIRQKDPSNLLV